MASIQIHIVIGEEFLKQNKNINKKEFMAYVFFWRVEESILNQLYSLDTEARKNMIDYMYANIFPILEQLYQDNEYVQAMITRIDEETKNYILERNKAILDKTLEKYLEENYGLKINSEICFDVLPHVYLIAHIPPYQIKMDPMKDGYDLTRVKIGSRTHGFKDLNNNFDFSSKLQVLAKEIDSNGSYFADECINMLSTELKNNNMYQDPRYSKFSNESKSFQENLNGPHN